MSDLTDPGQEMTQREGAKLMHISPATIGRLLNDGDLAFVRKRKLRRLYAGQVQHIVNAMATGRTGSIPEWAAEWNAGRQQSQVA